MLDPMHFILYIRIRVAHFAHAESEYHIVSMYTCGDQVRLPLAVVCI